MTNKTSAKALTIIKNSEGLKLKLTALRGLTTRRQAEFDLFKAGAK